MAKRKHIGTVILTILVAALLASGISGWLFWQSAQRVIGEAVFRQVGVSCLVMYFFRV